MRIEICSITRRIEIVRFIFHAPRYLMRTLRNRPLPDIIPVLLRILPGRFKAVFRGRAVPAGAGQGPPVLILAFSYAVA